ncbi:hypothetical protein BDY17DRAFT_335731 [Neohortaea acidophila]|uniref:RRM domain-containing protein n=1 Tax=Neohortaea acidophila TaxID=245834 RepID=A0A6A6PS79_9PEZI|nr:uncharacterized protein BDY17DRAFT_335731 [Neohortaea acidophila]KAF2482077.1 hypothetical protein BDY17DRAFT_335731 [Neohortaea acidophila]
MSQDAPVSRKEKKAQRDAERRGKGKKRKREEVDEQQDETDNALQQDFIPLNGDKETAATTTVTPDTPKVNGKERSEERKTKKRKKSKSASKPDNASAEQPDDTDGTKEPRKSRFILFIGNLPYATTDADLKAHFQKIEPFTLRHRTDPKTKKSKGFAFLEFENYDRMKTLFEPSTVGKEDEGAGKRKKKEQGRRINVELTAGGGGTAEGRKEKIKAKNVRLDEQRKRRAEVERKEKEKQRKKGGGDEGKAAGNAAQEEVSDVADDTAGIHPSRLARVQR